MKKSRSSFFTGPLNVYLVLIVPALLLYAKSLGYGFSAVDEQWLIVRNSAFLEKWSSIPGAFTHPVTEIYYRPLFTVSLIIDYHLGKLSPFVYHLSNLAWHLACVVLTYRLLTLLGTEKKTAFVCTLLFSVHPVLLHAVAWVPGRNDLMLSAFILTSLICLKKYIDSSKLRYALWHLICFACALLTKETAVLLPLIFLAFYRIFKKASFIKNVWLLSMWVIIDLSWLLVRNAIAMEIPGDLNDHFSSLINLLPGFLFFIGKAIYPFQQSIMPVLKNTSLLPGVLTLIVLAGLCFIPGLKDRKIALLGGLIFVLLLVIPVFFGITKNGGEHYEHRIYSAMTGLILFFTQVRFALNVRTALSCAVLFVAFLIKTGTRMPVYENQMSFVDAGVKECPDHYLFYLKKADLLRDQKDFAAALPYYNRSLAIRPDYAQALNNRGFVYYSLGQYEEAIDNYSRAIGTREASPSCYFNRCLAYYKNGDAENAMKDLLVLKKCCRSMVKPELEERVKEKWVLNLNAIKTQLQVGECNAALYCKLASLYLDIDMREEGLKYLEKAGACDPASQEYRTLLQKYGS